MKRNILLFFILLTTVAFSQFSKTHYIPPLGSSSESSSIAEEQFLYISTPSTTPVNFKVSQLGGTLFEGAVTKSAPYTYSIGRGIGTVLIVDKSSVNKILTNKGFTIEADDLIYVSARIIAGLGNQSGALVSKGMAALGKEFRIGALLNTAANPYTANHYTFVAVLATENNTKVQFSDIKSGVSLINNAAAGNTPSPIILNRGESFVMAVEGPKEENRDGLIGSLVTSDKPIALNCGSFAGSNAKQNLDLGFDQIVSAERTGKEYIFIKSTGQPEAERVLLVANDDNTEIFLNGNSIANYVLSAGEYVALNGNDFSSLGNLYVRSSKNVFAYQTVGDRSDNPSTLYANQELFFVPPLTCETPNVIDNIPFIEKIGNRIYRGRVTLITQSGSSLNFEVNGTPYSISSLDNLPGISISGPTSVTGNSNYTTYVITGLTGKISAFSSGQLYLAAYGTSDAATFDGFYSGFTFKPEVSFSLLNATKEDCIPNKVLSVNTLSAFDVFQWYYNDLPISGATKSKYTPTKPGYYFVKATISDCGTKLDSDKIPVSSCPTNLDNDIVNDNLDIDIDNDGVTNCNESLGNKDVDLSDNSPLNISTTGTLPALAPFSGTISGDFVTETSKDKNSIISFKKIFPVATNILFEYVNTANTTNLLNDSGDFILNSDSERTITVINPSNQLLIDTNYDGIYESGITQFSSFEIRFRLNSSNSLKAGTGDFKFQSFQTTSISFTHKNLSELDSNKATFKLTETCSEKDSDLDGVSDFMDLDSDNDGIPDATETQGKNFITPSKIDLNLDGLDDTFLSGLTPVDTDNDGVPDYLDLDSDNDGIYDLTESGNNITDTNLDGVIDNSFNSFGSNGLFNSIETFTDSGILNYTVADTDSDKTNNYLDLDSDNDGCLDTIESGNLDDNGDGLLGNTSPEVNSKGVVNNALGYAVLPNLNYITFANITIISQPIIIPTCELQNATATIETSPIDSYQWQILESGNWNDIVDGVSYTGSKTKSLKIIAITAAMKGFKYRVKLLKDVNSCIQISDEVELIVYDLPIVNSPITLKQCDDDALSDGFANINLTQNENFISSNYQNEVFTYFKSTIAAKNGDTNLQITNPLQYLSGNTSVWTRVQDKNQCFSIARIDAAVTATQIPSTFLKEFYECDDFLDINGNNNTNNSNTDGITSFNFSSVTSAVNALLPTTSNYTIKYYKNLNDASAETDINGNSLEISQNPSDPISIFNYRNIGYSNQQEIWIRIDSTLDNDCFALGPYIKLYVETIPVINDISSDNIIRRCADRQGNFSFDTSYIQSSILKGQANVLITYSDDLGNPLSSPLPNPIVVKGTKTITVKAFSTLSKDPDGPCAAEKTIQFIADVLPEAFPIPANLLEICDDEPNPKDQNGILSYDTSTFEPTIIKNQTQIKVEYADALGNLLQSPLPNPFITSSQNIKVKVSSTINTSCIAQRVLRFVVEPLPVIDLNEDGSYTAMVCKNLPNFKVALESGILNNVPTANFKYKWYRNGIEIPNETSTKLLTSIPGTYTVDVSNRIGCFRTRTINITSSDLAIIKDVKVTDLLDSNTIEIIADGIGDYEYSIDLKKGFQTSPLFLNAPSGILQVYVKDKNGCGTVGPIDISVLGIPKFFTPNNDGANDTWNIKGINTNFNPKTRIEIFNRKGKLLKQLNAIDKGWDGNYNGEMLPSDDYWYVVTFENNKIVKGHFSLKR